MERRNKNISPSRPGSIDETAPDFSSLTHIAELIEHGQITVGTIHPVGSVAIANEGRQTLAMLRRHNGESFLQLLQRLDLAVGKALIDHVCTDEVNTPHST
jgi:hypothetical protein